jgi:hypothetical protein
MLQWDGEVMMVMVMVVMMMILMKPTSMTVTMAMISPLWEGISPADLCLPEISFPLSIFRPAEAAEYFSDRSPSLRFLEDDIREGALAEVDQGCHTTWQHGLA